jgi:hypothetical protein
VIVRLDSLPAASGGKMLKSKFWEAASPAKANAPPQGIGENDDVM